MRRTAVGEKDITTHVDFTALQQAGAEAGLVTLWFGEQYRFLHLSQTLTGLAIGAAPAGGAA